MWISKKSTIKSGVLIENDVMIFGPSIIGEKSYLGSRVIIGYPCRRKLKKAIESKNIKLLDELSDGARIGRNVVMRPLTVVYEGVVIGNNVETGHHVLIRENTVIGNNTIVGTGTIIDGRVRIGSNVRIESGVYIPPLTVIEDEVFLGPRAVITNDKYPISKRLVGVTIRKGAVIGANATLIAGIEIGEYAVVGAGSVVTKDVPPNTVVVGVPAKPITSREEYERKKKAYEEGRLEV